MIHMMVRYYITLSIQHRLSRRNDMVSAFNKPKGRMFIEVKRKHVECIESKRNA